MKPTSNHKFDPEEYRDVMSKTVKMTTIGRRKIGSFLSGGLDSTVILRLAKSQGYEIHAVSYNYGQRHFDKEVICAMSQVGLFAKSHKLINCEFFKDINIIIVVFVL